MKIFKFILLCLVGFNFLFSIGCSDSSGGSSKRKPDLEDPDFRVNPPSPGPSRGPGFIIRGLPDYDVTVSIFRGPRSTSQCTDADLIPLGDPVQVRASENEITVNLGNVLENASDGIYKFFARIEGGPRVHCFELTYVLDTTVPRIIANTLEQNPLENDDTMRMSKTWNWSCVDRDGVNCTYRHKIDETALTGSSCPSYTFASNESYSSVSTATKPGGSGKYCIHIQAMDDANNESEVVSVYATLDNTAPTISSVSVPSKTYAGGDRMDFTVTFSEDVEVTGTPRISLILDGGGQPKMEYAEYASGSGSTSLIFRYEVGQTDLDTDGIGMGASPSIDLNSGNLKDSSGNAVSSLTFTAPGNLSSVVVAGGNPNVVLSLTELSVEENAGTGTYQIRLNSQPTSAVTVALGSADSSVATVSPGTLSFSTDNWSSPQTVTVTGVNDSIDNDAGGGSLRTVNITHTVTSSDADYNNFSVSPVEITSNDNDDIGSIRLTVNPSSVDEHDSGSSRSIANNTETIVVIASFHGSTSGGQANANIRLPGPLTISASLEAGTAQIGDFNPVSDFDLNIPAGSNQVIGAFSLTVVDDGEDEGNEILLLRGVNPLGLTVSPATITIVDNDEKGVIVSRFTLSVGENGGEGTYTVKLDSQPAGPVTVHIVSNDPDVVTVSDDTLTFEPDDTNNKIWSAPQTVTVTGVNDDIDNDVGGGVSRKTNVTHSVTSTDPHYNGLSVDSTEVTASDDDHIGFIQLTVSPASVDEHDDNSPNAIANNTETVAVTAEFQGGTSGGQANANIRLPGPLTISASVGAGTAQAADFTTVNNFDITIPSGGSRGTGTFSLTLVDDELDDNDETLSVSGSTPLGLTINPATITIVDNDDRGLIISHSTLSLVEDGTRTYTVQLSQEPTGSVYVTLISGDTNVATISHTLLTFEPDNTNNNIWSAPHTVTVTGINDNMDNDFGGNPHRTTDITYDVSSTDTDYNGLVVSPMKVTSVDDDNVGSVQLTISPTSMNEHDGALPNQQANNTKNIMVTAKFQGSTSGGSPSSSVVLSDPLAISTFVSRRTAQIEDFIPASNFDINIPAGSNQAEVTFPLTLVDDFIDEDDETLIVGGHTLFSSIVVNPATLTIVDNDERGVIVSRFTLSVGENGGEGTYTVKLDSQPAGPVTVHIVSNDPDVVTVSDDTLTFEPDDTNNKIWSAPQTVTVTGVNDDIDNDVGGGVSRKTNVTHSVTSTDPHYNGLSVDSTEVTASDDDHIGFIQLTVSPASVDEHDDNSPNAIANNTETVAVTAELQGGTSGGQANANIRLPGPLTISASVGAGTAQAADFTTVNNFDITIPSGGFRGTGAFSLMLIDDELDDNDETLSVSGSTPLGLTINPATITIVDNDDRGLIISHSVLSVGEDGGTQTYTVQLSQEPTGSVYVTLISGDTNVATISHTLLTFEPDNTNNNIWSAPKTVTVTGINDNMDNDFGGNPHRTTDITYSVSSTDTDYNGLVVSPMKVTSVDDDDVGSVQLTISPTSMNEHDGALPNQQANNTKNIMVIAKFQGSTSGGSPSSSVVLSDPLEIATFLSIGTAQIEDFIPASNFDISIPAGSNQAVVTFPLTLVDDFIDEDDETLIVGGHTLFSSIVVNSATLTILDNDEKGVIVSETSLIVYEDGGTGTYEVSLKSEPTGPVRVYISSGNTRVATVSPSFLIFEPDDTNDRIWTTPLEVTVTGVNDTSSTNDRQTTITHTVTGGDYGGLPVAGVSITSRDSSRKVTIDNAVDILSDNYESYSVGGVCSGTESVSVQVGSTMTAVDTDCTNGEWLKEGIDTSSDVTANGPVTITATQDVTVSGTATSFSITADVTRCVSQGAGTSSTDPHWICNYSDLKSMYSVTTRKYFILGMDIDASPSWSEGDDGCGAFDGTDIHDTSPCSGWTPLNGSIASGEFDGQGHIIEKLYINTGSAYVGLFGELKMKIKNLHLRNVFVNSTRESAASDGVGGIAGKVYKNIENCSVTGIISSSGPDAGGLAGGSGNSIDILNSYTNVEVSGANSAYTGGLAGFLGSSSVLIMSSYSKGSVTVDGDSGYVGGLVGWNIGSNYYASYSHAEVSGGIQSGGLIGNISIASVLDINHCYSLGDGSPDDPLFDIGTNTPQSSSNLFWDTDVGGGSSEAPTSTGLSTANMQVACSSGSTTGICALGAGFHFSAGSYPKVKKCTTCNTASPVFGDVLEGQ